MLNHVVTQKLIYGLFSGATINILSKQPQLNYMVLESVLNPKNAGDKPLHIFVLSFFYSLVAVMFSTQLFPSQASILSIALITIIFIPFFQKVFELEEVKEDLAAEGKIKQNVFSRHSKSIVIFSSFFFGIIISMSFIFIFFPNSYEQVFSLQVEWFRNQGIFNVGFASSQSIDFTTFFLNNTQVMLLMFMLSVIFGAGAIFILVWNASIIAVFLGIFVRSFIEQGFSSTAAYILGIPVGLGSIALHGIPEILAYFFAGLAGGILSVGIIKENIASKEFKEVFKDALFFLAIAEILIIVAAFAESVI